MDHHGTGVSFGHSIKMKSPLVPTEHFLRTPNTVLLLPSGRTTHNPRQFPSCRNVALSLLISYRSRSRQYGSRVGRRAAVIRSYVERARPHFFIGHAVIANHADGVEL